MDKSGLVKELYDVVNKHLKHMGAVQTISLPIMISEIQDIIIADRRRIVSPLVELGQIKRQPLPPYEHMCQAIEKTLELSGDL